MKLGFTTHYNIRAMPVAKECGFDCIEISSLPGHSGMDLVAELDSREKMRDFRAASDVSGIEVQSIITVLNPMNADAKIAEEHMKYFRDFSGLRQMEMCCADSSSLWHSFARKPGRPLCNSDSAASDCGSIGQITQGFSCEHVA